MELEVPANREFAEEREGLGHVADPPARLHIVTAHTAFLRFPRSTILIRFLTWEEVGRDGEGGEGFEEVEPGGEDREGRQGCEISEEARSLFGRFSGSLPGRLDEVEHGAPSEGEHVEGGALMNPSFFRNSKKLIFGFWARLNAESANWGIDAGAEGAI